MKTVFSQMICKPVDLFQGGLHRPLTSLVGLDHDRYRGRVTVLVGGLDHGFYADAVIAESAGYGCQYARFVEGAETQHVFADDVGHRLERQCPDLSVQEAERCHSAAGSGLHGTGQADQVADDGAGGRVLPGAATVEHDRSDKVAGQADGVEDAIHFGQRVVQGDHGGVDTGLDLAVGHACRSPAA